MRLKPESMEFVCKAITAAFDLGGLQQLTVYRLGFRLDTKVQADSLDQMVFKLVEYTEMTGETRDLLGGCIHLRPKLEEMITAFSSILEQELGGPLKDSSGYITIVQTGIHTVQQNRGSLTGPLDATNGVLNDLRVNLVQIRSYKELHDHLHLLQLNLRRFSNVTRQVVSDPSSLVDLNECISTMRLAAGQARPSIDALPSYLQSTENEWLGSLQQAITLAEQQKKNRDPVSGRRSVQMVKSLLRQNSPRIDRAILDASNALDVRGLVDLFKKTSELPGTPPQTQAALTEAQAAATSLITEINARMYMHSLWQRLDGEIWEMADLMPEQDTDDTSDFDAVFLNAQPFLHELIAIMPAQPGDVEAWFIPLERSRDAIEKSLGDGDWPSLAINFSFFRTEAVAQFFACDSSMRDFAKKVSDISQSLSLLLNGKASS
ncbi:MAG: hypothetical protein QM755_02455 [Luteolibacter sp.]